MEHARVNSLDNGTDMSTVRQGSSDSDTDVKAYDMDYTGGNWDRTVALYTCTSTANTDPGTCQQGKVQFDLSWLNSYQQAQRESVACHETGHSVGLDHHSSDKSSCLHWQTDVDVSNGFNQHDKDHINGRW